MNNSKLPQISADTEKVPESFRIQNKKSFRLKYALFGPSFQVFGLFRSSMIFFCSFWLFQKQAEVKGQIMQNGFSKKGARSFRSLWWCFTPFNWYSTRYEAEDRCKWSWNISIFDRFLLSKLSNGIFYYLLHCSCKIVATHFRKRVLTLTSGCEACVLKLNHF